MYGGLLGDRAGPGVRAALDRHPGANEAYACAEQVLTPYRGSADKEIIATAAEFMTVVYRQHQKLNDSLLELLRTLGSGTPGQLADTISTLEVERGKLWNDLIKGATLCGLGLLDKSRTGVDGNINAIVLTRAERASLLDRIGKTFPAVSDALSRPETPTPTKIAALYRTVLMKNYRCADE